MRSPELRQLTDEELAAKAVELRDSLFELRIKHATGQLENNSQVRTARRNLARALTIQSERKRAR